MRYGSCAFPLSGYQGASQNEPMTTCLLLSAFQQVIEVVRCGSGHESITHPVKSALTP